jgi:hypothetical protein
MSAGCQLDGTSRESKWQSRNWRCGGRRCCQDQASPPRLVQSGVLWHVTASATAAEVVAFLPLMRTAFDLCKPVILLTPSTIAPLPLPHHLHYSSVHERISKLTLTLAEDCARRSQTHSHRHHRGPATLCPLARPLSLGDILLPFTSASDFSRLRTCLALITA